MKWVDGWEDGDDVPSRPAVIGPCLMCGKPTFRMVEATAVCLECVGLSRQALITPRIETITVRKDIL